MNLKIVKIRPFALYINMLNDIESNSDDFPPVNLHYYYTCLYFKEQNIVRRINLKILQVIKWE